MNDLKISIVMPSFNSSRFIHKSIESVISQTYKNWELLIVDDCSTDDTYDIAKEYERNDNRIKVFRNDTNRGAAFSRNIAIKNSSGDYIAFLDSDDKWHESKLEKQINFMLDNNYVFSYTNYSLMNELEQNLNITVSGPKKVTHKMMLRACYLGCLTVMFKKNIYSNLEIPDTIQKRNDYALWILISQKADCYLLNENLSNYRKVIGGISSGKKTKLFRHHVVLFKELLHYNLIFAYYRACVNVLFYFLRKLKYTRKEHN